ncbi:MAG: family 16 glycoside hydrolase [Tepidisphaeraceae bacterium]
MNPYANAHSIGRQTLYSMLLILALLAAPAPAAEAGKAVELFNGKDLTGWKMAGPGSFEVKDGTLLTVDGMGLLWHEMEMPEAFTLSMEFMTSRKEDNSGVFVRFPNPGADPWVAIKEGYELQICEGNEKQFTGTVYNLKPRIDDTAIKPVGEWNLYEITLEGQKMTVKLNGKVINEYTGERKTAKGHIGLQNHDPKSKVSFRNIKVTPIDKPAIVPPPPQAIDEKRAAGMVGRYFKDMKNLAAVEAAADAAAKGTKPFYVRVDDNVGFRLAKGQFHKTKLATNFGARWIGYLRIDNAGEYTLAVRSDDGARVYLADTLVIDNDHVNADCAMKDKTAKVKLDKGDYTLRVDYVNQSGPGGIQLAMKNAEGKTPVIDQKQFFHDAAQATVEWDQAAWNTARWSYRDWAKTNGQQWDKMDYGRFVSHTVELSEKNHALKGITISLGDNEEAAVCFDTDLVRFAGGWIGGFLELKGVVFDGSHGTNPAPDGEIVFQSPPIPGATVGDAPATIGKDPRTTPYGPIPRELAKYKGMHVNGNRVVLHYMVGDVDVLDAPWAQMRGERTFITRTIKLSASDKPLTMLLDRPDPDRHTVVKVTGPAMLKPHGENRYLVFPPRKEPTSYVVAIAPHADVDTTEAFQPDDIDALVKAGPARWTKDVVTKGAVSAVAAEPYVLDTLTVPEENPYGSWMRFGGLDFFADGRAAVSTWSGDVWIISGIDDKLEKLTWKRFATGLFQPLGLKIVDDQVYVLGRDQITRFKDTNNDGEADLYENFNNDCHVSRSFHEFSFDLQTDPQGNFYFAKAGPVRPGGRGWEEITAHNGCILKISKDGGKFEVFATGVRAPNGMGVGPNGEVTVGENEGTWAPTCRISLVKQGDFLGVVDLSKRDPLPTDYDKPICWLPHGDVDNSSGGQAWVTSDKWGPFQNRLLHTSYGTCSLFLTMVETVEGQIQGGVVKFPKLDFNTGICRPRMNPIDKQLYVAGLRGWQTTAAKDAGLQRIRYTGQPVKMPTELHVTADGVAVTFTTPLDESIAKDITNYAVEQWNYKWSGDYGSAEYSVIDPKEKGHDAVEVETATLSPDKKTIMLKLEEVAPVMQMKIQMKLKSADGTPMEYSIYNTINKVPGGGIKTVKAPATTTAAVAPQ